MVRNIMMMAVLLLINFFRKHWRKSDGKITQILKRLVGDSHNAISLSIYVLPEAPVIPINRYTMLEECRNVYVKGEGSMITITL
jgi:hypothetical protein